MIRKSYRDSHRLTTKTCFPFPSSVKGEVLYNPCLYIIDLVFRLNRQRNLRCINLTFHRKLRLETLRCKDSLPGSLRKDSTHSTFSNETFEKGSHYLTRRRHTKMTHDLYVYVFRYRSRCFKSMWSSLSGFLK